MYSPSMLGEGINKELRHDRNHLVNRNIFIKKVIYAYTKICMIAVDNINNV